MRGPCGEWNQCIAQRGEPQQGDCSAGVAESNGDEYARTKDGVERRLVNPVEVVDPGGQPARNGDGGWECCGASQAHPKRHLGQDVHMPCALRCLRHLLR